MSKATNCNNRYDDFVQQIINIYNEQKKNYGEQKKDLDTLKEKIISLVFSLFLDDKEVCFIKKNCKGIAEYLPKSIVDEEMNNLSDEIKCIAKPYKFIKNEFITNEFITNEGDEEITPLILQDIYIEMLNASDEDKNNKRNNGVFYTNQKTADEMCIDVISMYFCEKCDIEEEIIKKILLDLNINKEYTFIEKKKILIKYNLDNCKMLDLCVGCGNLTIPMVRYLYLLKKEVLNVDDISSVVKNLYAIDIDNLAVDITKRRLLLMICEHSIGKNSCKIENDIFINIKGGENGNALKYVMGNDNCIKFDIIISNPPYCSYNSKRIPEEIKKYVGYYQEKYEYRYKNNYNLYYLFYHIGLDMLKKKGYMIIISNNCYFYNICSTDLRKRLYSETDIMIIKCLNLNNEAFTENLKLSPVVTLLKKENKFTKIECSNFHLSLPLVDKILFDKNNLYKIIFFDQKSQDIVYQMYKSSIGSLEDIIKITKKNKEIDNHSEILKCEQIYNYKIDNYKKDKDFINFTIPTYCELNRFAINNEFKKFESTIIRLGLKKIDEIENNNELLDYTKKMYEGLFDSISQEDLILFLLGILNSKLIMFYLLMKGSRKREFVMYINTEVIKKIPLTLTTKENIRKIIDNIKKILKIEFINGEEEKAIELKEKVDELIYDIYGIKDEEKLIIDREVTKYIKISGKEFYKHNLFYK